MQPLNTNRLAQIHAFILLVVGSPCAHIHRRDREQCLVLSEHFFREINPTLEQAEALSRPGYGEDRDAASMLRIEALSYRVLHLAYLFAAAVLERRVVDDTQLNELSELYNQWCDARKLAELTSR